MRDDLSRGNLVAPLGFVPGPTRLLLWVALHLARRPDAQPPVRWLSDSLRETEAAAT